jgi:acyl carrier protein
MIFEKVRNLIVEQFAVDEDIVTMDAYFMDDLGADSLDIVELTMSLEEEFELGEISDEDLIQLKTVGDVVNYIAQRIKED